MATKPPKFSSREEYEAWKRERTGEVADGPPTTGSSIDRLPPAASTRQRLLATPDPDGSEQAKHIKTGVGCGALMGGITLVLAVMLLFAGGDGADAMTGAYGGAEALSPGELGLGLIVAGLLTLGLTVGLYFKNRVCAVALFLLAAVELVSKLVSLSFGTIFLSALATLIFFRAMTATIGWHKARALG